MTTLVHTRTAAVNTTRKVLSRVTIAVGIAWTAGFVYSQLGQSLLASTIDEPTASALRGEAPDQVGAMAASRKVRCIMPPAWRRGCEE